MAFKRLPTLKQALAKKRYDAVTTNGVLKKIKYHTAGMDEAEHKAKSKRLLDIADKAIKAKQTEFVKEEPKKEVKEEKKPYKPFDEYA